MFIWLYGYMFSAADPFSIPIFEDERIFHCIYKKKNVLSLLCHLNYDIFMYHWTSLWVNLRWSKPCIWTISLDLMQIWKQKPETFTGDDECEMIIGWIWKRLGEKQHSRCNWKMYGINPFYSMNLCGIVLQFYQTFTDLKEKELERINGRYE